MFNSFFENHAVFWNNVGKYCRVGQNTDDNMAHAGYLRLQTHTQYVILFVFPLQQWLHERASLLRYSHIVCLVGNGCIRIIIRPCHCVLEEPVGFSIKLNRINGKPVDPIVNEESWVRRCVPGMIIMSLHIRRRHTTPRHATPVY